MNASGDIAEQVQDGEANFDLETVFRAQYQHIARVIARVVRDQARADELAVEVFLKLSRNPKAAAEHVEGWLYRTAVRIALDELRHKTRRLHYENLLGLIPGTPAPTPEDILAAAQECDRVRRVLAAIASRQAELLLLRSEGLSYEELASSLHLNAASVGTLLSRAQQAFRKEYIKRYGNQ